MKKILSCSVIFLLISCSSYRPILDPSGRYLEVGELQAEADIDVCKKESEEYLDKFKAERAAKEAGRKAAVGGIIGAGTGYIFGKNMKSTLTGTAIGVGAGIIMAGVSVYGGDKIVPDEIKQRYITNCLARKGYSVIGWK